MDSHAHTHLCRTADLEEMRDAGVQAVVSCAYLPVQPSGPDTLRDLFRWLTEVETARLQGVGLRARVAVGIHPRCIPGRGVDAVLEDVERLLATGRAAALGEVGLEAGTAAEEEVLLRQLCLAARVDAPVVLHTPRVNKVAVLARTLELLRQSRVDPARVVVDHLVPELVGSVRAAGAVAGLTVQPGKLTAEGVAEVLRAHGPQGLVVNSDLSPAPSDPAAVARVAEHLHAQGFPAAAVDAVTGGNAAALFP